MISVKKRISYGNPGQKPGELSLVFWKGGIFSVHLSCSGKELFSADRHFEDTSLTNFEDTSLTNRNNSCMFFLL